MIELQQSYVALRCVESVGALQEMSLRHQVAHLLSHHKALELLMSRLASVSRPYHLNGL
jgi:hypothetical protein